MYTLAVLKAARELLSEEKRWTQGYYARDALLHKVDYFEKGACRFCSIGALKKVSVGGEDTWKDAYDLLDAEVKKIFPSLHLAKYNDLPETTHADILALFDRAIEQAELQYAN